MSTYREEMLTVVLAVLEGTTDKDIDNAIERADKLLTKVDRFMRTGGLPRPTPPQPVSPLQVVVPTRCQSGRDGDCNWSACPQLRDNEPAATGRHCPLDDGEDGYE